MAKLHSTLRKLATATLLTLTVASCSQLNPLGFLTGGGTNVAANTQLGQTNTQTIGTTNNIAPNVSVRPNARVDNIDQRITESTLSSDSVETVTINEIPPWIFLVALLGWLLPTPTQMAQSLANFLLVLFRRKQ